MWAAHSSYPLWNMKDWWIVCCCFFFNLQVFDSWDSMDGPEEGDVTRVSFLAACKCGVIVEGQRVWGRGSQGLNVTTQTPRLRNLNVIQQSWWCCIAFSSSCFFCSTLDDRQTGGGGGGVVCQDAAIIKETQYVGANTTNLTGNWARKVQTPQKVSPD